MHLTLSQIIAKFLAWARAALAEGTVAAYEHQLRKFADHAGNKKIASLRPMHLTSWAKSWHEGQAVVRMFNWAVKEARILKANPFAHVKLPPRDERQRIMTEKEMVNLLRAAQPEARRYLMALRETFARPQEIRAACWEDLQAEDSGMDLDVALAQGKALIVLREYKDRKRRKEANKPRILLVSKRLGRQVLRIKAKRKRGEHYIWMNAEGKPWTNNAVHCLMRRLRKKLGIKADRGGEVIVAYSFRHSVATLASARGIRDRTLADLLGHVETRTTQRYQHLDVEHLREAIERMKRQRRAG